MPKISAKAISRIFLQEEIDIFICSSSFEDRCFDIPTNLICEVASSVVFYNSNEDSKIVKNAKVLSSVLTGKVDRVALDTEDPVGNYVLIAGVFESLLISKNENVFIDITTFTHETLLIILKIVHQNRKNINKIIFGYVGASEYSYNTELDSEKWLSKGIKEIRTVLGYSGYMDPTLKNHLIILFGFESDRTQRLIEYYEFNKVSLGFVEVDKSIQSNHYTSSI